MLNVDKTKAKLKYYKMLKQHSWIPLFPCQRTLRAFSSCPNPSDFCAFAIPSGSGIQQTTFTRSGKFMQKNQLQWREQIVLHTL